MNQTSIFDMLYPKYKITRPILLIEMFGGYGSQYMALKRIGANVKHHKLIEWAAKSIQAYNDIHVQDYTDYSKDLTDEEVLNKVYEMGVSLNYNEPATKEQLKRQNYRKIYNNIIATNNLVNIQNVKGKDLEMVDTDKYDYIWTYSFPCQDLSNAGLKKGFNDTSTRSGMLWEVERILEECDKIGQKPRILLMENVIQVHSPGENLENFHKWQLKLESLGYKNYMQDLIATDYGIPQTRNRCFMVSILGDYSYTFPQPIPLKLKLKDLLEENVDEKYYLSDKMINCFLRETEDNKFPSGDRFKQALKLTNEKNIAGTITTAAGNRATDNFILTKDTENYIEWEDGKNIQMNCRAWKDDKIIATLNTGGETKILVKNNTKQGYLEATEGDGIDLAHPNSETRRGRVQKETIQTLTTQNNLGVVVEDKLKKELCNKLIQKGLVEEYDVVKHSYTTQIMEGNKKCVEKNDGNMITLTTRSDCIGVVVKTIGNYSPSNHNASRIVDSEHCSPTVMENHGTITATQTSDLRIRKLTPKECFRLMGVSDEDFEKCAKNQSNASLYHLAGDSIVVNVLMAIFKEMI